jgi:hypothetical protein
MRIFAGIVVVLAGVALAQEAPKAPTQQKEHKWLKQLEGEWVTEGEGLVALETGAAHLVPNLKQELVAPCCHPVEGHPHHADHTAGRVRHARPAPRMSATPIDAQPVASLLGEHTDEVLRELGRDAATIAALRHRGVVA